MNLAFLGQDKYSNLFKIHNLGFKIIELENNNVYRFNEYKQNQSIVELLEYISSVDVNNLSITEAYQWIEDVKNKVSDIRNLT